MIEGGKGEGKGNGVVGGKGGKWRLLQKRIGLYCKYTLILKKCGYIGGKSMLLSYEKG